MAKYTSVAVAFLMVLAGPVFGQTHNDHIAELWGEAVGHYNAEDMEDYLNTMLELEELRPHQRVVLYNVASGYSLTGQVEEAMIRLESIAQAGLYIDVEADSDFEAISEHPRYAALIQSMHALTMPQGSSALVREFELPDDLPEGIAFDERSGDFFVSTVHRGEIWRISPTGAPTKFVSNDQHPGIGGLFGMAIDHARNILWVSSSTPVQYGGSNASSNPPSAVFGFDLNDGTVRHYLPLEGEDKFLGEITLSAAGDVFASDSTSPAIYRVSEDLSTLLNVYSNDQMRSFQGFDFDPEGRIYIADYVYGIYRVDLEQGLWEPITSALGMNLTGVDGLFYDDGALIVIRNGAPPHRILRHHLSGDGLEITHSDVLASNLESWTEPTLGQIVDGQMYYLATSGWPNFGRDGEILEGATLGPIRIMSIELH